MSQTYVSLYRQTLALRQQNYNASIAAGEYVPFLYPWDSFFALYPLLAIIITPRLPERSRSLLRYLAFTLVFSHSWYVIVHRRTLWFAGGYGIGLCAVWGAIMSGALMLFNDPERDFWRLEAREIQLDDSSLVHHASTIVSAPRAASSHVDVRRRKVPSVYTATNIEQNEVPGSTEPANKPYQLVWQGFPYNAEWIHVIDWTVDLVTGFRGVNWNHRIPTLAGIDAPIPPMPTRGQEKPISEVNLESKPTAIPRRTLQALQRRAVQDFLFSYLMLDVLKTSMVTDPYFLGLGDLNSPSPWLWLSHLTEAVPFATRFLRLGMSMAGVVAALTFIFSLSPLFFTLVLPALVDVPKVTKSPLLEPWLYPPQWHPLTTSVLHTGLAGFWGKFWHQMFRYGFSQPSRVLIRRLELDPSGNGARIIQLLTAFALSGSVHAAGSFTAFSLVQTHPVSGSLLFFILQAFGVFTQTLGVKILHTQIPMTKSLPQVVRQTANAAVTLGFLYFTGPLLANDFAQSGIWLFEPVPVSILRGLGFGPGGKDEGLWAWSQDGSTWVGWWTGRGWWETGLAIF
ncbi:uncharacterized protein A1O9_06565 [Exophiala aquamarina CBS 119918]|uniref:Wax synthase domain-containing protein n=1 Tax=Exophiala aquamarina CBS 119918 TaxID=1182545 RepID=A0A072PET4_9EURO|nr:uncharacterized protein A1O9_06565 [Exophiala aquamarina CBS 119918]KEF58639.1 hypothetical protein A1O9_06565 [Exophiala aquamarina CBS 119918]